MRQKQGLVFLLCFATTACGHQASDVNPRAQWGSNLSQLGILPLYPPREDVYVGDVFMYVQNPCKGANPSLSSQSIFLGSIPESDVATAFENFYRDRPQLVATSKRAATSPTPAGAKSPQASPSKVSVTTPGTLTLSVGQAGQTATTTAATPSATTTTTASASASSNTTTVPPQPIADDKDPIFFTGKTHRTYNRSLLAAFPDFSYSNFTAGSLSATIPVHVGVVSIGGDHQSGTSADVSVSQVEELSLPEPIMYRLINKFITSQAGRTMFDPRMLNFFMTSREATMISDQSCPAAEIDYQPPLIIVVGHAYYARAFNHIFSDTQASSAALSLALATAAAKGSSAASSSAPAASGNAAENAADAAAATLKSLTSSTPVSHRTWKSDHKAALL